MLVPRKGLGVTTANITYHVGSRNEGLGWYVHETKLKQRYGWSETLDQRRSTTQDERMGENCW